MSIQSAVYISQAADPVVKKYIRNRLVQQFGCTCGKDLLIEVPATEKTYPAVASHADLYCCAVGDRILTGVPYGHQYPQNIGFNGVQLGAFFVHNLKHTASEVAAEVKRLGLIPIHVKQGYTKCNMVVVDSGLCPSHTPAIITADEGIAKALSVHPIHILLVEKGHVLLPDFPYGFLGGATGSLGRDILFHGDLSAHPDFEKICDFIRDHGCNPVWFPHIPLTDIGSIITLL